MKYIILLTIILFVLFLNTPKIIVAQDIRPDLDLSTALDSASYTLGNDYASAMVEEGVLSFSYEAFVVGMKQVFDGQEPYLTDAEMELALQRYQEELQGMTEEEREQQYLVYSAEGRGYLIGNAQKEDVHVTESGLQYRIISEGSGDRPISNSTVRVQYRGMLIDGEIFDSSYDRGKPAEFPLDLVITGWTEGLQLMTEGSIYELFIPSDLAYGNNPPINSPIKPGDVLIFEVELLEIID